MATTYHNPMKRIPFMAPYTPMETLDIMERMSDEAIEMVQPKALQMWAHTVSKSNFILAQAMIRELFGDKK